MSAKIERMDWEHVKEMSENSIRAAQITIMTSALSLNLAIKEIKKLIKLKCNSTPGKNKS